MFRSIMSGYQNHTIMRDLAYRLAIVLAFLLIIWGAFNYRTTLLRQQTLLEEQAVEVADSLVDIVTVPMWNLDVSTITAIGRAFEQTDNVAAVHIEDNLGRVLYQSTPTNITTGLMQERTVFFEEREIGYIRIHISTETLNAFRRNILLSTSISVIITITAVIFFTAYLLQRYLSEPISNLRAGIDRLASGDYQYRFHSAPQVELNAIIHQINHMAAQIEERDRYLEQQVTQRTAELAERVEQLALLNQVSHKSNAILNLEELLSYLVQTIRARFDLYIVTIFLIDQEHRDQIRPKATATQITIPADLLDARHITIHSQGMVPHVANTRELCLINDVTHTNGPFLPVDFLPDTRAELALPLRVGRKMVGVLDLQSAKINGFNSTDLQVLQTLSDQVAITVRNAQLYHIELNRRQLAESLERVGRQLSSSLDLTQLPQRILQELASILAYQCAALVQYVDDKFYLLATHGYPQQSPEQILDQEKERYQQIVTNATPIMLNQLQQTQQPTPYSWLAVPLISKNKVVGILSLTQHQPNAFTHNDQLFISTFASQTAIALENAGLYDQISRFNEQLEQTVTERTEELSIAYQNLERLNKSKADFLELMTHELRTPLTIITGYAQILQTKITDKRSGFFVQGIEDGAERLHILINSMLDVFQLDNKTLRVDCTYTQLESILSSLKKRLQEDLEKRAITLHLQNTDNLPDLWADPNLLKKLFQHLLINAIKYTPDNGEIVVTCCYQNHATSPKIQIQITDSGIGIDDQEQKLIFEKFYQIGEVTLHSSGKTKFKGGGAGLGLAIAKGIVTLHEGCIWVESKGHDEDTMPGSTFFVELPVREPETTDNDDL